MEMGISSRSSGRNKTKKLATDFTDYTDSKKEIQKELDADFADDAEEYRKKYRKIISHRFHRLHR